MSVSPSTIETAFSSFPTAERGLLRAADYMPLSLHGCEVAAEVRGQSARVTVAYEYVNETAREQTAVAAFPQPLRWSLQRAELAYDGDVVTTYYDKSAVFASSESASALAAAGSVADRAVWTVACMHVPWPVAVGGVVRMTAVFHVSLADAVASHGADGSFRFELPAGLFPQARRPAEAVRDYNGLFATAQHKRRLQEGITVRCAAELFVPLRGAVTLSAADFHIRRREVLDEATVDYIGDTAFSLRYHTPPLEKTVRPTFTVACDVQGAVEPVRLFVERSGAAPADSAVAVGVSFTPAIAELPPNAEVFFVVDSHSPGTSVAAAHALYIALLGLPPAAYANVLLLGAGRDGEDVCLLPGGSAAATQLTRDYVEQLCAYVAEVPPQRSRTGAASRLPDALAAVLAQAGPRSGGAAPRGYVRNVIVLSDEAAGGGSEGSGSAVTPMLRAVAQHRAGSRVSAVAVDVSHTSDVALLEVLAREGGGLCRVARTPAEVPGAVVAVVAAVAVPTLTDVHVQFVEAEVKPTFLADGGCGPIAAGTQLYRYGLAPALPSVSFYATGRVGDKFLEYTGSIDVEQALREARPALPAAEDEGLLHLSAVAARVRHLMEENGRTAPLRAEVDEAVALSKAFQLPSPYTSLMQRRAPADDGYHAPRPAQAPGTPVAHRYAPRAATYESEVQARRAELRALRALTPLAEPAAAPAPAPRLPFAVPSTTDYIRALVLDVVDAVLSAPNVERLVPLQRRDGGFALGDALAACLGRTRDALTDGAEALVDGGEDVWATVLALVAMRTLRDPLTVLMEARAAAFLRERQPDWEKWAPDAATRLALPSA